MIDETLSGIGFAGTFIDNSEIKFVALFSFFDQAIELFLTVPFRGLIVELLLDCNTFGLPIRLWFQKRQRKPPDKLLYIPSSSRSRGPSSSQLNSGLLRCNPTSLRFRFWQPVDCSVSSSFLFQSSIHQPQMVDGNRYV